LNTSELLFGTHEWAEENYNFINGCSHDCKYCYSKEMAIRFKRKTKENWKEEEVRDKDVIKKYSLRKGTIMFPSSHDITPKFIDETLQILGAILAHGNKLLIVTKPHLECIQKICDSLFDYKEKILFRFTIGSLLNNVLKFWEPGAPSFEERLDSLQYAFRTGYQTSVSCEPMLDKNTSQLIDQLLPYITETIWVGKANFLVKRMRTNGISDLKSFKAAEDLNLWQNDDNNIIQLYETYCDNKKIKWKESIKKVLMESTLAP